MLHPHTELRWIDERIGFGVFATRPIPRGTVTWVRDELDQVIAPAHFARLPGPMRATVDKYSFVDRHGDYILCWDVARFLNHACEATCLSPGFDFEIAIRDIAEGDQVTDDYGSLNIDVPFECLCGSPRCRREIRPDDLLAHGEVWDRDLGRAFCELERVAQPLWELVREKDEVGRVLCGGRALPSCRENYCPPPALAQGRAR